MLSYKILSFTLWLMIFSTGYFISELLLKKFQRINDKELLKYTKVVLFVLSFCVLVWVLFNKELFHWNFDIATGMPVNHYSTYKTCVIYSTLATVINFVSFIVAGKRTK